VVPLVCTQDARDFTLLIIEQIQAGFNMGIYTREYVEYSKEVQEEKMRKEKEL
jgi:hypothetical protein